MPVAAWVKWLPVVAWLSGCKWLPGQVVARGCLVKWLFLKVMQEQRVGAEECINLQIIQIQIQIQMQIHVRIQIQIQIQMQI